MITVDAGAQRDTKLQTNKEQKHTDTKEWGLRSLWPETLVASPTLVDRKSPEEVAGKPTSALVDHRLRVIA